MAFLVKAIYPDKAINPEGFRLAMLAEINREGEIMRRMYEKTVKTWSKPRPIFKVTSRIARVGPRGGANSESLIVEVETNSLKFLWVDKGTKPHTITARNVPLLKFRRGGKPKTKVRVIGSTKGAPAKGAWVSKRRVKHPGTKARQFTEEIEKRRRKYFFKNMEKAMLKAQKRHAW